MSDYTTEYERTIRSTIQPRNVIIQRSAFGGADQRQASQNQRSSGRSSGALVSSSGGSVGGINDKRKQEKKDMQDLNERFASYIEKVRFLEAQNRKLSDELDSLKTKWGKQTTVIKSMYEADLEQVKKLLEETEKDTSALQIKVAALEEKIDELKRKLEEARQALDESRNKLEQQISQIASLEAEANLVRLRTELLEGDKKDNKNLLLRLQDALTRARADLDRESNAHVNAEEERQALEEELEFLKELHDQELRELAAQSYVDPTNANREMWKSEMGTALKQMQQLYDEKMDELKADLDTNYSMQMQTIKVSARPAGAGPGSGPGSKDETIRIRTQTNELRNRMKDLEDRNNMLQREIDDLRREKEDRERELEKDCEDLTNDVIAMRAEMEAISRELGNLVDAKLGLEMEIEAYRKLLEGETNQEGLKQVVDSMFNALVGGQSSSSMSSRYGGEESSSSFSSSRGKDSKESGSTGRTTFQRSAKGPLAISECTADGKCVIVENTGKKTEDLGGWSLKRTVDSKEIPSYTFKQGVSIEAHAKLRLYTKGEKPSSAGPNDIETDLESFGVGQNITTQLFNPAGQDRASHIQKTVQN